MSFMTKFVLTLVLIGLVVGVVMAETTFTVDKSEFARPAPGESETFTLSVCETTGEYQVAWVIKDYHERYEMPTLIGSGAKYDLGDQYLIVKSSSDRCDTFTFRTLETTTPSLYQYRLVAKEGQYFAPYERQLKVDVRVLDPSVVVAAEEAGRLVRQEAEEVAKVAALEAKIAEQDQKIAALEATTTTTAPEITTETTTIQESPVQTFGELAEVTIPLTYAASPTVAVDETRIAELEAKIAAQQQQIDEQKSWIDQILVFLGLA